MRKVNNPEDLFDPARLIEKYPSPQFKEMIVKQRHFHSQIHEAANQSELTNDEKRTLVRTFEQQNLEFSKQIRLWCQSGTKAGKVDAYAAVMALPSMVDLIKKIKSNRSRKIAA